MTNIAIITDTHIGARNDSIVFNNYFLKFIELQFLPYLEKNNIKTIFHLGDLFDRRKYINFQILHSWNQRFFEVLEEKNIHLHVLCGNHDVYYKNTNAVNSVQELLSYKYNNISIYHHDTYELHINNSHFIFVPWITLENKPVIQEQLQKTKANICLGHFDIVGFEMYKGLVNQDHGFKVEDFMQFEQVLTGHYHHKSSKDNIHYLGSPYEMNASDYNDSRGFHVFNTISKELTFVQNPYKMYHRIKYDESKLNFELLSKYDFRKYANGVVKVIVHKRTNEELFEMFMSKLHDVNVYDIQIIDNRLHTPEAYDEIIQTKDTREILKESVEALQLDHEKEVIACLDNLYLQALSNNKTDISE